MIKTYQCTNNFIGTNWILLLQCYFQQGQLYFSYYYLSVLIYSAFTLLEMFLSKTMITDDTQTSSFCQYIFSFMHH